MDEVQLEAYIRDVPDWPAPGVVFKDLTPLLADPAAFASAVDRLCEHFVGRGITKVLGVEARGFVIAAPVAYRLGAGFVPARKLGKLPRATHAEAYELEYGADRLEVHLDAIEPGEQVLVVDDVLATGGTARAAGEMIQELGASIVEAAFVIELLALEGRGRLPGGYPVRTLLQF